MNMLEEMINAYENGTEDERMLVIDGKAIVISVNGEEAIRFLGKDARATYMVKEARWTDYRCRYGR